jgi:hypothetical protein
MEHCWNDTVSERQTTFEKNCSSTTLSTMNPTQQHIIKMSWLRIKANLLSQTLTVNISSWLVPWNWPVYLLPSLHRTSTSVPTCGGPSFAHAKFWNTNKYKAKNKYTHTHTHIIIIIIYIYVIQSIALNERHHHIQTPTIILPTVLHEHQMWSLTMREEQKKGIWKQGAEENLDLRCRR